MKSRARGGKNSERNANWLLAAAQKYNHLTLRNPFPEQLNEARQFAAAYASEQGYFPKMVVVGYRVYGIGNSQKNADLSLELAQAGALEIQLAEAGINYMTDAQREFIENGEVESYRSKQV